MDFCAAMDQSSLLLYVFHDNFISIFHVNVFVDRAFFGKFSIFVNWNRRIIWMNDPFRNTHLVIFLAKSRRAMDDTCTGIIRNKIAHLYFKASILFSLSEKIEHRDIFFSLKVFSLNLFQNFICLFIFSIKCFQSGLCQYKDLISFVVLYLYIIHVRFYG